jgi:hypothetical protein
VGHSRVRRARRGSKEWAQTLLCATIAGRDCYGVDLVSGVADGDFHASARLVFEMAKEGLLETRQIIRGGRGRSVA